MLFKQILSLKREAEADLASPGSSQFMDILELPQRSCSEHIVFAKLNSLSLSLSRNMVFLMRPYVYLPLIFLVVFWYYKVKQWSQNTLYYQNSRLNLNLVARCKELQQFQPAFLLTNTWLQSIFASVREIWARNRMSYSITREILRLPDGGQLAVDFQENADLTSESPILLVIPGLTGCTKAGYIRSLLDHTNQGEFRVCVMMNRGCGGVPLTTPLMYCAGWTKDIRFVVDTLHKRWPDSKLYGCGFSLGSNMLTNYVSEQEQALDGFVSVCNPLDLTICARSTSRSWKIVGRLFNKLLRKLVLPHLDMLQTNENLKDVDLKSTLMNCQTVGEFDHHLTARMFGYNSGIHYYTEASCLQRIHNITIPGLFINARDDFVTGNDATFDEEKFVSNPNLLFCMTQKGSHIGYLQGLKLRQWHPRPIMEYLSHLHHSFQTTTTF